MARTRKRKAEELVDSGPVASRTRSSTRLAASPAVPPPELRPKKKRKAEPAGTPTRKGKGKAEPAGTPTRKGKEKAEPAEKKAEPGEAATRKGKGVVIGGEDVASSDVAARTIVIEHCKQGRPFKTRATEAKDGIELAVPGVTVLLNPDNEARKGCFEIREQDGETFISLLDLKRPYKPLEDLDMDEVIAHIVKKMKP